MFKIVHETSNGDSSCVRLIDTEAKSSATIHPGYGFNCSSFTCLIGGVSREILYSTETFPSDGDKPTHNGTPILVPFPNRIRGGEFRYQGRAFALPCNEAGKNAIHGFAVDQPWRIVNQQADESGASITGQWRLSEDRPDYVDLWPGDFTVNFCYKLCGTTLRSEISVENTGDAVIPFGIGTHPYFRFPLDTGTDLSKCEIVSPADKLVELDACLPTGETTDVTGDTDLRDGQTLDTRTFDDVFTGLTSKPGTETVEHFLRDRQANVELAVTHSETFGYSVIYTPPHRQAICIEPYTCLTDALNLEGGTLQTGLWHLHPGEIRHLFIEYNVREL